MPTLVTKYKCDYCGRLFSKEHNCRWHETNRCPRNPAQEACLTCDNFHCRQVKKGDEFIDDLTTEVCCTSDYAPWIYHCNGWVARKPGWQHEVPFTTSVNFVLHCDQNGYLSWPE